MMLLNFLFCIAGNLGPVFGAQVVLIILQTSPFVFCKQHGTLRLCSQCAHLHCVYLPFHVWF